MAGKSFGIVMFSGTADKFIPLGVLAQTAANLGVDVKIFVTGWALLGFKKDGYKTTNRMPKEFEDIAPMLVRGLADSHVPSWYEMLKSAKEMGNVKIYACSLMSGVMKLKKKDLDPIVDDIVGAAAFMQEAANGQVIFI